MQHDEPRRPGAARPSLLSAEPAQAEAARTNILGNLEGGKKPVPVAASASQAKPAGKGMLWGGAALMVALLGGGAAWLASEPGSGTDQALAEAVPPATALPPAPAAPQAPAAPGSAEPPAAAGSALAAAGVAAAGSAAAATAAAAPGNSADLVAALAAPSKPSAAATIQDDGAAQQQSLRDMLNAPPPAKATPSAPKLAKHDGKAHSRPDKAEKPARTADKSSSRSAARTAARSGKAAPPAKAQPAPAPDSDVALLAALVAHTHATRPAKQPEPLSAKLKQCRQLNAKGAEQCRVRTCASAKDDPLCKPVVTAAVDGAFP